MSNLNSLQSTIQDLKEIVQRSQGINQEATDVVRRMEQILADIERKTRKQSGSIVVPQVVHTVPVI